MGVSRANIEDWSPLDPAEHQRQLASLRRRLAGRGSPRVLDLGCGAGRLAEPLTRAGCRVLGVDLDEAAIAACSNIGIQMLKGDAFGSGASADRTWRTISKRGPYDAALCLGNTFLLVWKPEDGRTLFKRAAANLRRGGILVLDDFSSLWREVAEGNWQEGVSPDGKTQLVWADNDNVLALRRGRAVNRGSWRVQRSDQPMRLWSMGELTLLAKGAGFKPPRVSGGLSVFTL